jgi:hypothetical protein
VVAGQKDHDPAEERKSRRMEERKNGRAEERKSGKALGNGIERID